MAACARPTSRNCRCWRTARLVGILDESDMLPRSRARRRPRDALRRAGRVAMTAELHTLQADAAARRAAADLRARRGGDRRRRRAIPRPDHAHRPDQPSEARAMTTHPGSNRLRLRHPHHPWRPEPDPTTGAVMTPIYATSTYAPAEPRRAQGLRLRAQPQPDALRLRALRRRSRRRRRRLRLRLRAWRRSRTVLELLDAGAHVVAIDDLYGGTFRLFERVRKRSAGPAGRPSSTSPTSTRSRRRSGRRRG